MKDRLHCSQKSHSGSDMNTNKMKVSIGPQVCSSVFIRRLFCAPCTVHLCSFYPTDQEQPQVLSPVPLDVVPTEGVVSQRQQFPQSSLQWLHLLCFSDFLIIHPLENQNKGKILRISRGKMKCYK